MDVFIDMYTITHGFTQICKWNSWSRYHNF